MKKFKIVCAAAVFTFAFALFAQAETDAITDKDGRFRNTVNGEEIFYTVRNETGISEIYVADEAGYSRRTYDRQMRLLSETSWQFAPNKKTVLVSEKIYTYDENAQTYKRMDESDYVQNIYTRSQFNEKGLILAQSVYLLQNGKPSKKPVSSYMKKYDDKNRVVEMQSASANGERNKILYTYNLFCDQPNLQVYEKNMLVSEKIYKTAGTYEERTYFEGGDVVVSVFTDGIKTDQWLESEGQIFRSETW